MKGEPQRYLLGHLIGRRVTWATDEQKDEICHRYLDGEGSYALAREFGVHGSIVGKMLNQRGVERRSMSEAKRVHSCNHSFFEVIDTEEKAYWLGFMAADGNVVTGRPIIKLALATKDRAHVVKFRDTLKSTHALTDYTTTTGHGGTKFSVASPQLTADLARQGIFPNKTFALEWPSHLDPDYLRHYLRGYFDGDGSLHLRCTPGQAPVMRWEIVGNEGFCLGAQQYLIGTLGLRATKLDRPRNASRIRRLVYSGRNQVSGIYHLMYDGATVYLPRKRERIQHIVLPLTDLDLEPLSLDGRKLRKLRKERGMPMGALAAKASTTHRTVRELENGVRMAHNRTIRKLASALGVEPQELAKTG